MDVENTLMDINSKMSKVQSDLTYMKEKLDTVSATSVTTDEKIANRLEEYFDFAKKRQDNIKQEMEVRISSVELDVKELKDKRKNQVWDFWQRVRGIVIAGICSAIGAYLVSILVKITGVLKEL